MSIDLSTKFAELADRDVALLHGIRNQYLNAHAVGACVVVDGTALSPSWRALPGGSEAWDIASDLDELMGEDGGLLELYVERLDDGIEELGLFWEDGDLWWDPREDATGEGDLRGREYEGI